MRLNMLPPRMVNKALFRDILRSTAQNGMSRRNGSVLDRLFGRGRTDLQWCSLESACRFYGLDPWQLLDGTILFVCLPNADLSKCYSRFCLNYSHLLKAA